MTAAVTGTTGLTLDDLKTRLGISTASTTTATSSNGSLDQTAFLKLMTTQLQNQDPFAPVDNTAMVAQMAQMSSVSGIAEMNTSLKAISSRLGSTDTSAAISYVGKSVLVKGSTAYPGADGGITAYADIDSDATGMTAQIKDSTGKVIRTLDLGAQKAGEIAIDWDGKTDAGAAAGDGPFNVSATAQTAAGTVAATTLVWAPVTSVNLPSDGSTPTLQVAGIGATAMSDVRQVG